MLDTNRETKFRVPLTEHENKIRNISKKKEEEKQKKLIEIKKLNIRRKVRYKLTNFFSEKMFPNEMIMSYIY